MTAVAPMGIELDRQNLVQLNDIGLETAVSLGTPAASPASTSAWRTHLRSVSAVIPNRDEIAHIAAHSES
jgi:hypothetical protein